MSEDDGIIAPEELYPTTEKNSQLLRQLFNAAYQNPDYRENLIFKNLGIEDLNTSASTFTRWTRGDKTSLDRRAHRVLVDRLYRLGALDPRINIRNSISAMTTNGLFHAAAMHLEIPTHTLDRVADRAVGTYRVWRPSMHWKNHFVLGMLKVSKDTDHSIKTIETHRFTGSDQSVPRESVHHGYMLRKSNHYFIIARDDSQRILSFTLLNSTFHHEGKTVIGFGGASLSVYGNRIHAQGIYLERWADNDDTLLSTLDLVEQKSVPRTVLEKLADFQTTDFDVRF